MCEDCIINVMYVKGYTRTNTATCRRDHHRMRDEQEMDVCRCRDGTEVSRLPTCKSSKKVVVCGHCLVTLSLIINEALKWL